MHFSGQHRDTVPWRGVPPWPGVRSKRELAASRTGDMDGVNVAHRYVRSEGNVLRRALPAEEFADILHFEVCWLDSLEGDRVTPHLHTLGRGNVYVVVTTQHVHFVALRGVDPVVATLPLREITKVEGKGPVPARFFHSHIHGELDAMRVAKRFEINTRRVRPGLNLGPGMTVADFVPAMTMTARPNVPRTSNEQTSASTENALQTDADTANAAPAGPVMESATESGKSKSLIQRIEALMSSWRAPAMPRPVPTHPTPVRSPPPEHANQAPPEVLDQNGETNEANNVAAFDVRAALAEANERALDRIQRAVVAAAEEAEKAAKPTKLSTVGQPDVADALVPTDEKYLSFLTETIHLVAIERGSQALYQLESAVLVAHGVKAARDATVRDASNGVGGGVRVAAAEAAATLAASLPVSHLSCLDDFSIVVDATDDAEGGVAAGPVVFAADMARLLEHTSRDSAGDLEIRASTSECGSENGDVLDDAPTVGPESQESSELVPNASAARVSFLPPSDVVARLARGTCVAAPLMPALAVAVASLEAARVRREIEAARSDARSASPHPDDDAATNSMRRDFDAERALFTVLERAMLAPRRGAVIGGVGNVSGIVVERVGAFETDDLCAAAAMAEHAKRSHAIRRLALSSTKLFDAVAQRLVKSSFDATHAHPALRRRRAFCDDKLGFDANANWARLILAARQGAAAHRAAHLFHWTKMVLARSEGAAFERLDLCTRESGAFASVVQAAFIYRPLVHSALRRNTLLSGGEGDERGYSEDEYASLESDSAFHALRPPSDATPAWSLDMTIDTLHECISCATHAHLMGGGDGWNTPQHLVAHHMLKLVPPRDVRPKVAAIFQRMVNAAFEACPIGCEYTGVGPQGANAVRAFRCATVLRHLIEGSPDSSITKAIRDEYDVELKHVFTRADVYERTTRHGDAFYEKHARAHFNWVMREVCPDFGKAQKEASKNDALALWREEMTARGQNEMVAIEERVEAGHRRHQHAKGDTETNENVAPERPSGVVGWAGVVPGKGAEEIPPMVTQREGVQSFAT